MVTKNSFLTQQGKLFSNFAFEKCKEYLLWAEINWLVSARKYYDDHYIFWKQIISDSQGQLKGQGQFSQQSWNMSNF